MITPSVVASSLANVRISENPEVAIRDRDRPTIHLISGLPRSGSTLLSALLRQNPGIVAGVSSPLAMLCSNLLHSMSGANEYVSFFNEERRLTMIRSLFDSYYAQESSAVVVFDTNRNWTARLPLLARIFPDVQVICCVRSIGWILDSVERLVRKNALQPSRLFNYKLGTSVYSRIDTLMDPEKGMVGSAWSSLREAWFSEEADRLLLIDYDALVQDPARALTAIYERIGLPSFQHQFDNIRFQTVDFDADLGLPGLHDIRPTVSHVRRETCLPPDVFAKYTDASFWLNLKMNPRAVKVIRPEC